MPGSRSVCRNLFFALVCLPLLAACGDEDVGSLQDGGVADAAGFRDATTPPDATVTPTQDAEGDVFASDGGADAMVAAASFVPKGLVVVHQSAVDYNTTSVSVVDLSGTNRMDDCIHSGSTVAGLTTALSGNVYLPSNPIPTGEIVLIDSGNEVVTFLNPVNCAVKRQIRVGPSANKVYPQDFLWIASDRAYVSRNAANKTPTAAANDFDEGNDILMINPTTGELQGRIDIEAGTTPQTDKTFRAKPSRMAISNGKVFVALNNIADGLGAKGGDGRVAVIDVSSNKVEDTLVFPGIRNCGSLTLAAPGEIVVACNGDYASDQKQIDFSGIVLYKVSTKTQTIIRATPFGEPINNGQVSASGRRFFATTYGEWMNPQKPSRLWTGTFDGEGPSAVLIGVADGDIGTVLVHPLLPKIYVADALIGPSKIPQVRVFDVSTTLPFLQEAPIPVGANKKFPVRGLAWF